MSGEIKPGAEWDRAAEWGGKGKIALATVVSTWGSAPRPKGSLLVVREDGLFEGSVSGGCIEGEVVTEALDVMKGTTPKLMEFGVSDEQAWGAGLACGGRISVLVEPAGKEKLDILKALNRARREGAQIALATRIGDGRWFLFREGETAEESIRKGLIEACRSVLAAEQPELIEHQGEKVFINVFPAPYRLFIVGAVHITQALAPLAAGAGYDVAIIDPRGAFAEKDRFPNARVIEDWPDDMLAKAGLNRQAAVVTLTHDPKLDDAALKVALMSDVFYIGSLGSSRTHAKRLERLKGMGFSESALSRIHGPAGLKIGAKTPFEIAVSILAEMTAARRLPKAGPK